MKLAEALQERADCNRKIEQLRERVKNYVLVQEGDTPEEDPVVLKRELDASLTRLAYLMTHINHTNCVTKTNGMTLTEIIAKKDMLILSINTYKSIVSAASNIPYRTRGTEIKIKPTISVAKWQSEIDKMAKELRELDNKLQETNWNTDLIE